jgi:signal transduction histidine kinase
MLRQVNVLARSLGFAVDSLFTFISPPHGLGSGPVPLAQPVQIIGCCVAALGLIGWSALDLRPAVTRRRSWAHPLLLGLLTVGAGCTAAAGGSGVFMIAFSIVAALAAGSDDGLPAALAVAGAGVLGIEITGLAFGGSYGQLLGLPVLVLSGLLVGRNRGAYRIQAEQSAELLAQREQLQSEHRRADLLDERARIAREIHDVLAHSLGALGIQIQAARAVLTDHADIDRANEILTAAQRMAAEGLVETRRAVHALRAGTLPLDEELAQVSDTHARRYQVTASFGTGGAPAPLPPDAALALLRVAQESLVNAAKHAAGQRVAVRLDYGEANIRLTVRNDLAPGTSPANSTSRAPGTATSTSPEAGTRGGPAVGTVNGGYGLTGMRERLRLLNGTLQAGPRDSQWVVTAEIPRPQPQRGPGGAAPQGRPPAREAGK